MIGWIERFGLSAFAAISGCQNGVALIFQKLCRIGNAVDCSFDPQSILFVRIFGSKDLARQCSRLVLALAGEGVPPGGSVCGWNWPFRLSDRRADSLSKTEWHRTATSNTLTAPFTTGKVPVGPTAKMAVLRFLAVADHFGSAAALVKSR